ncbi:MAG: lytic transglycosylase domain-containing protein [Parvularculaceae bacterium]
MINVGALIVGRALWRFQPGLDVARLFLVIAAVFAIAGIARADETPTAPTVLSQADVELYREIFSLQDAGRWDAADRLIAQLQDDVLLGYVKYQRYMHPTAYRSQYGELKQWMAYYADHPEAEKIYALALKRRPKGAAPPVRPITRKWKSIPAKPLHPDLEADYARTSRPLLNQIEGRVRYLAKKEQAAQALREIEKRHRTGAITTRQFDRMRSWIAASLYYQGYVETAKKLADEAASRSGESAVLAYWIAGLIDFRNGDYDRAHKNFSAMAANPYQEDDLRSAAAFWTARTALADGHAGDVASNLEIAADFPFTFYGQLALAQLGKEHDYNWTAPAVEPAAVEKLFADLPQTRRAVALDEVGKDIEADIELRWVNGRASTDNAITLLALATALNLPAAQIDIAMAREGRVFEPGLYPVPDYIPSDGFTADRALLYALMRQESKFKVEATSRVGAKGLMQLMPRTASYVAKDRSLRRGKGSDRLYDPAFNMSLGQSYVNHLIERTTDGDLFEMAVAYNGGPGNLRRWKRDLSLEDPLLFIESIPNPESRDFVERVLTNFWVYRARLGQTAPSREEVAAGRLPLYEALDQISAQ